MKLSRLILTALLYGSVVTGVSLPNLAVAAEEKKKPAKPKTPEQIALEAKKKKRPVEVMSEKVGKQVGEAYTLALEDKLKEAIAAFKEIEPKKEFDNAYVNRLLGILYAQDGDYKLAYKHIKIAADLDVLGWDDQASSYQILATLSLSEEKYADTIMYYDKWYEFTLKHDENAYAAKAYSYYQLKQYDKVIEESDKVIKYAKKPKSDPYQMKMTAYLDTKQNDKAIEVANDALKVFPEDKKWWLILGQLYLSQENFEKALSSYVLSEKQGFFTKENEYILLGQLYSMQGTPYKGAVILEEQIKKGLVKKTAKNLGYIATYYRQAMNFEEAADTYMLSGAESNDPEDYRKAGESYNLAGDYKKAIKAYKKALELDSPKADLVKNALIDVSFYAEDYKSAYKYAKESLESKKYSKSAKGWIAYIKETAKRKGVDYD
ncbi:tetratricopeptide repeat protein [Catenovulum maritimum]|uniref:Uncharacterized protein n=1 Tax=Catenovulum maritimum TaxID=1513271 RepID=A0A0J8JJT4_9ALTE|nr:tetratricopeptide repeat protein [Catenovulum maritimum]KMT64706.1 hypothetical protein XM47_12665 [Catenovulum maritimum]